MTSEHRKFPKKPTLIAFIFCVGTWALFLIFLLNDSDDAPPEPQQSAPVQAEKPINERPFEFTKDMTISAENLVWAFNEYQVRANNFIRGRGYYIHGYIASVTTYEGTIYIDLKGYDMNKAICILEDGQAGIVGLMVVGDWVKILGKVAGVERLGDVIIQNGRIIEYTDSINTTQ